jgi:DNA invertase Pin-like site-specific DNA recombinase
VLIAWSVDRISRDGATGLLKLLERLDAAGAQFLSVREPYLDSTGPFRDVVLSLLGTFANMEKTRLRERVLAGLARARAAGVVLGRPRVHLALIEAGLGRVAAGESLPPVARNLGVGETTLRRARGRASA